MTMSEIQNASMREHRITRTLHSVSILGVRIHDVNYDQTLKILQEMALSGHPHHIMTVNPEFIMLAKKDEEFRRTLEHADLIIPDGVGIVLAAKILGTPIKERVTGVDTVMKLAHAAGDLGLSIFLLGAAPGVAEKTAVILQQASPGLTIAGTYSGSPRPEEENTICSIIEKVRPHILLVAYGPPKQDLWIARTQSRLKIPVAIGVGGTFDFIAGIAQRAPRWMQRIGLEWLYRLIREPRRWRRQLTLPMFAFAVLKEKFHLAFYQSGEHGDV